MLEDDYADIKVEHLNETQVETAVNDALQLAGYTWPQLQAHAEKGCFPTETARRTWFVVSSLI
ncbi:MAG: hypothetical protein OXI96_03595 [Acidimicrobiaceae bacterium]|nr:hypothetical protein [Acidimicrobiaceae bacterium]